MTSLRTFFYAQLKKNYQRKIHANFYPKHNGFSFTSHEISGFRVNVEDN